MTIDYSQLLGPKYNGNAEIVVEQVEDDNVVEPEAYSEELPVQNIPKPTRGRPKK